MQGRIGELLLVLLIFFLLFGAGKLPNVMKEIGKGLKTLKKGLDNDEEESNVKRKTTSDSNNNSKNKKTIKKNTTKRTSVKKNKK
jgi:sec-independent protein translocase protein TatA